MFHAQSTPSPDTSPLIAPDARRFADVGAQSARGTRRSENQDELLVSGALLAVADGVGGRPAGRDAAALTLRALLRTETSERRGAGALRAALDTANRDVRGAATGDRFGMAATVVAAQIGTAGLTIAHVGDSRAYLWRSGALHRLTDDHSLVAVLQRDGLLDASAARHHPQRSAVLRAVGLRDTVAATVSVHAVCRGDVIVLCSDGISEPLGDQGVAGALAITPAPQRLVDLLVRRALLAGGGDDMSAIAAVVR